MKKMKKLVATLMALAMVFVLAACGNSGSTNTEELDLQAAPWEDIVSAAKGTTVAYYGYGGDEQINQWLDNYVAPAVKEKYDVTLTSTAMGADEYMAKMTNEKQAGTTVGDMDILWINGENFYNAKEQGMIYGPIVNKLPMYEKYYDAESKDNTLDFAYPTEGYEAPFSKAQFVLIGDTSKVSFLPNSAEQLLDFVKAYPGKFTYPEATDFTGSAFIRNIIYELVGYDALAARKADDVEGLKKTIQPAMDYLKELKPYLWRNGDTYPSDGAQLDQLFSDGEIFLTMSYNPLDAAAMIEKGTYPETAQTFVFEKGMIGNTSFLAIPTTAPNKAGAMVVIDFILDAESQLNKYDPKVAGKLPVIDNNKLTDEQKAAFAAVDLGKGTLAQDYLASHMIPEVSASLVPVIEQIWRDTVLAN